jgi:hypothetical protein
MPKRLFTPDDPGLEDDDWEFAAVFNREADVRAEIDAQQDDIEAWLHAERKDDAFEALSEDEKIGRLS